MSLREKYLALRDFKVKAVEVPEWGETVYVRTISTGEAARVKAITDDVDAAVALVVACVCDESGTRVFTAADSDALKDKSLGAISRLAREALLTNGMGAEDVDAAKKD